MQTVHFCIFDETISHIIFVPNVSTFFSIIILYTRLKVIPSLPCQAVSNAIQSEAIHGPAGIASFGHIGIGTLTDKSRYLHCYMLCALP